MLSGGLGFHSNDARGTTITVDPSTGDPAQRVDPLVRSRGAEVGFRAIRCPAAARSTLALWMLNLDSELLFTGDAGTTEPSAESQRRGVTFANFYRPLAQLVARRRRVVCAARSSPASSRDRTHIPGALENVVAGGITWSPRDERRRSARVRLRHFGSYPLIEDNSVRAHAVDARERRRRVSSCRETRLQVSAAQPAQRRAGRHSVLLRVAATGRGSDGTDDVHFHPVEPRQIRISLGWGL